MKIINNNSYNDFTSSLSFKNNITSKNASEILEVMKTAEAAKKNPDIKKIAELAKGEPPKYVSVLANTLKKRVVPYVEKYVVNSKSDMIKNMINIGNCLKEFVCMVVYPIQVLTNPDLPKDKKRFVGMYDFFVTCFSLGGAVLYMWKGTKASDALAARVMKRFIKAKKVPDGMGNDVHPYPNSQRALSGASFVLGLFVQNLFFKRVLAPALSPPLASWSRKKLEERDARLGKTPMPTDVKANAPADTKKDDSSTLIPAQFDAALGMNKNETNLIKSYSSKK